jgi:hypothetical protein
MPITLHKRLGETLSSVCQEHGVATVLRTEKGDRRPVTTDRAGTQGPVVLHADIPVDKTHRYVGLNAGSRQFEEIEFGPSWHPEIKAAIEKGQLKKIRDDEWGRFYEFSDGLIAHSSSTDKRESGAS